MMLLVPRLLALTLFLLGVQPASAALFAEHRAVIVSGAPVSITVWARDQAVSRASLDAAFAECQRLDQLFSAYRQGSEVSAVNQYAGERPVQVSRDTLKLFERSLAVANLTEGAYDPTAATFVWQYGFGQGDYHVPSVLRLQQLKPLVNYRWVVLYPREGTVLFKRQGMQVDLDDFYRSELLDRLPGLLHAAGAAASAIRIRNHFTAFGQPAPGQAWEYAVADPADPKRVLARLPFRKGKILTAGDYERCFYDQGKRYHPFVDTTTGLPAAHSRSATLLLPDKPRLELPAAALLLAPPPQALAWVRSIPGAECLIVDPSGQVWTTPGWSRAGKSVRR